MDYSNVVTNVGMEKVSTSKILSILLNDIKVKIEYQANVEDNLWTVKKEILKKSATKVFRDPLNYGFFCPAKNGRSSKFLDEVRSIREFSEQDLLNSEFRYKRKNYRWFSVNLKKLKEINSQASQLEFISAVANSQIKRVEKFLRKGIEPNFINQKTGETPLTTAIISRSTDDILISLVAEGAILDFRNKIGNTPIHEAAFNGNLEALTTLLRLGSSPNYRNADNLTPLYLCITGSKTSLECCEMLLKDYSILNVQDESGNTELHQAVRLGRTESISTLISYGANINALNVVRNTPLHIAALNNQDSIALDLLLQGADKKISNSSNLDPYLCAGATGNTHLANLIQKFKYDPCKLSRASKDPSVLYNPKRRVHTVRRPSLAEQAARNKRLDELNEHLNRENNFEGFDEKIISGFKNGSNEKTDVSKAYNEINNSSMLHKNYIGTSTNKLYEIDWNSEGDISESDSSRPVTPVKLMPNDENTNDNTDNNDNIYSRILNNSPPVVKMPPSLEVKLRQNRIEPEIKSENNNMASIRSYHKRFTSHLEDIFSEQSFRSKELAGLTVRSSNIKSMISPLSLFLEKPFKETTENYNSLKLGQSKKGNRHRNTPILKDIFDNKIKDSYKRIGNKSLDASLLHSEKELPISFDSKLKLSDSSTNDLRKENENDKAIYKSNGKINTTIVKDDNLNVDKRDKNDMDSFITNLFENDDFINSETLPNIYHTIRKDLKPSNQVAPRNKSPLNQQNFNNQDNSKVRPLSSFFMTINDNQLLPVSSEINVGKNSEKKMSYKPLINIDSNIQKIKKQIEHPKDNRTNIFNNESSENNNYNVENNILKTNTIKKSDYINFSELQLLMESHNEFNKATDDKVVEIKKENCENKLIDIDRLDFNKSKLIDTNKLDFNKSKLTFSKHEEAFGSNNNNSSEANFYLNGDFKDKKRSKSTSPFVQKTEMKKPASVNNLPQTIRLEQIPFIKPKLIISLEKANENNLTPDIIISPPIEFSE